MKNETVTVLLPDGSQGERGVCHKEMDEETGMMISVPYTSTNEHVERLFGFPMWAIVETR